LYNTLYPDINHFKEVKVKKRRIIVGITGASGAVYGMSALESLKATGMVEIHLVISEAGKDLLCMEIGTSAVKRVQRLADALYHNNDLAAPISSGSFLTDGMMIAPCSAKTLSAVAHGYGDNLLHRAADVALKDRRKLVLLFRETPLHLGHIENMALVTRMGAVVLPPVPAFYHKPATIADLVDHTIGKVLDLFSLEHNLYQRWGTGRLGNG
jgi:polyprenyl P-hydroxybenzoate/phenylacrylic acid decarboxylase-like protein